VIVSGLVFSLSGGIIHTYYTVALAPEIAALVAIGAKMLWDRRARASARVAAALAMAITAGWSWELLDRTPSWEPWLRTLIVVTALGSLAALLTAALWRPVARRLAVVAVVLGIVASVAGPLAYAAQTVTTAHTGSVPSAGPASAGGFGGAGGPGGFRIGAGGGMPGSVAGGGTPGGGTPGGQTSAALTRALKADAGRYRWVAATSGSQSAASLELATGGEPVMAIGGFSGEGGNLTVAQFQRYVTAGEIHYYLASGGGGPGGRGGSTSAITTWVKARYKAMTIGGQTVYDLTSPLT
jgi:hypothetical protein